MSTRGARTRLYGSALALGGLLSLLVAVPVVFWRMGMGVSELPEQAGVETRTETRTRLVSGVEEQYTVEVPVETLEERLRIAYSILDVHSSDDNFTAGLQYVDFVKFDEPTKASLLLRLADSVIPSDPYFGEAPAPPAPVAPGFEDENAVAVAEREAAAFETRKQQDDAQKIQRLQEIQRRADALKNRLEAAKVLSAVAEKLATIDARDQALAAATLASEALTLSTQEGAAESKGYAWKAYSLFVGSLFAIGVALGGAGIIFAHEFVKELAKPSALWFLSAASSTFRRDGMSARPVATSPVGVPHVQMEDSPTI